jgi:peptidoglycan/xylan/chitin deacetylase (PgdA/CDA1 family)
MYPRQVAAVIPILCYHSVSEDYSGALGPYSLPPRLFRQHMAWVAGEGFSTMTAARLQQCLDAGEGLPARPLLITFDDGLADFLEEALPVLQVHALVATMFVTTAGTWSKRPRALAARRTLSRTEVLALPEAGVEVASHGHQHHQLDLLPRQEVERDLRTSKSLLEDLLQADVTSFAYPHGYNRAATRDVVRRTGFTSACAVRNTLSSTEDDRWRRARLMLSGFPGVRELSQELRRSAATNSAIRGFREGGWRAVRLARTRGRPLVTVTEARR